MDKTRYINQFFSLNCASELISFFVGNEKNAGKEVTEAFGLLRCYEKKLDLGMKNPDVQIVVIGDGVKPRCGATFAYLTKANVISIDPMANLDFAPLQKTQRLTVLKGKASQFDIDCKFKPTVLILPHSHCSMAEALGALYNFKELHIINMACCVKIPNEWLIPKSVTRDYFYIDDEIWSDKNVITVWKNADRHAVCQKYLKKRVKNSDFY